MTIVELLKDRVEQALFLFSHKSESGLPALSSEQISSLVMVEPCRRLEFGDFSCGVALGLSRERNLAAVHLAQEISDLLAEQNELEFCAVSVSSPGFINFSLTSRFLSSVLLDIHARFSETKDVEPGVWSDSASKNCYELCCSILRCATEPAFDLINETALAPLLSDAEWQECKLQYKMTQQSFDAAFSCEPNLFTRQKSLVLMLDRECGPAIAESFGKFYQGSRIFTDRAELTKARLGLVLAVKLVLEHALRS